MHHIDFTIVNVVIGIIIILFISIKSIAAAGILVRQSNIVWVMMSCMTTSLDIITNNYAIAKNQVPTMVNIFAKQVW